MSNGIKTDRLDHLDTIVHVMESMNRSSDNPFILKGGTALMLCYGLTRFSEDIDLDAQRSSVPPARFFTAIERACRENGYTWRKGRTPPPCKGSSSTTGNWTRL